MLSEQYIYIYILITIVLKYFTDRRPSAFLQKTLVIFIKQVAFLSVQYCSNILELIIDNK